MADGVLPAELLPTVIAAEKTDRYEYTGSGYFVTVVHPGLPVARRSLSEPPGAGMAANIQAGFVVYLGDGELTLECHTWGDVDIPESFREMSVLIKTPPDNPVDLRGPA